MKKCWMVLAQAVAMCAAAPAMAWVQASVTVERPQIRVVDLDPDDGIEAAWMPGGHRPPVFDYSLKPAPVVDETYGDGQLDPTEETSIGGRAWASGSGFFAVRDLYFPGVSLSVTPFTRVQLSVPYRMENHIDAKAPFGNELPNALSSFELNLVAINELRNDPDSGELLYDELPYARDYVELSSTFGALVLGSRSLEGSLNLSFDNACATPAVFAFRAELVAFGNTGSAAPVPEPATWAFWLAGAGLMVWRARRPQG